MSELFRRRRRKEPMYSIGAFCSYCQKWFTLEECDKGKSGVLLCPLCHEKIRRNRRGK